MENFEQFLRGKEEHINKPSQFDSWFGALNREELLSYAWTYGLNCYMDGFDHAKNVALTAMKEVK